MKVVSTFHPPSSVTDAIKCRLTSDSSLIHLAVTKPNRLDIYSVQPTGLRHECGAEIWGKIVAVRAIPAQHGKSNLLLLTDHPDPRLVLLSYSTPSSGSPFLKSLKSLSLHHHNARTSEFLHTLLVDPSGRVAVVNCYTGKIKVVELEDGLYTNDFDVMVSELNILSLAFLSVGAGNYAIAILHLDHNQNLQLLARDLILSERELSPEPSLLLPPTIISSAALAPIEVSPCLVTVQPQQSNGTKEPIPGGILVLGGRKIRFLEQSSAEWQDKHRERRQKLRSPKKNAAWPQGGNVNEQKAREIKKRKAKATVDWPWREVNAWCPANDEGTRFFVGDSYGRLALLSFDSTVERTLRVIPLGEVSPPTALSYLDSQVLFVGSHLGDSQLVRIHTSPISDTSTPTLPIPADVLTSSSFSTSIKGKGKGRAWVTEREIEGCVLALNGTFIEVLDTWQNVGPILDAVLTDIDGNGQPRIVTASGGMSTGSLRIIQNGAHFQTVAVIENMGTFSKIWPIRSRFHDSLDACILATHSQGTMLFSLDRPDNISIVPVETAGFDPSPTLAASNVARRVRNTAGRTSYEDSSLVVQVTEERILLLEYDEVLRTYSVLTSWSPKNAGGEWAERKIVAAALNPSQFVLGLSRKRLVLLNLDENNKFQVFRYKDLKEEISALSCTPLDATKMFSLYVAVGYWSTYDVDLLSVASASEHFEPVCNPVSLPALPRSLLLHDFDNAPQLLVGLRDGTLVAYAFVKNEFQDKRVFSLGTEPVALTQFEMDKKNVVIASGGRAALFFSERGILQHSSILIKSVFATVRINSQNWRSSLLLMTSSAWVVGTVQDLDKMHIRTVPLGSDSPRCLEHDESLHAFAVACVRSEPGRVGEEESYSSSLKLLDDKTFDLLCQFNAQNDEEVTAIKMIPSSGDTSICVGTVFHVLGEKEPSQGRLLLFKADLDARLSRKQRQLKQISELNVKGCVYALARVNGLLAAAIGPSVSLYKVDKTGLQSVVDWHHNYVVTSLSARGSRLFVGDAICSVSIIDLVETEVDWFRLEPVAKDFSPLWPVTVMSLDKDTIIGANSDCNLFTYSVQRGETKTTLERDGFWNLGEVVNKFVTGSMSSSDSAQHAAGTMTTPTTQLLFFTTSGRIGVVVDVPSELSLHLTALERNLRRVVPEITQASHAKYRSPVGTWGKSDADAAPYGFLDGDFLEKFLDYHHPSTETDRVLQGVSPPEKLKQSYREIRQSLEALKALH